jgi:hypothetical protein
MQKKWKVCVFPTILLKSQFLAFRGKNNFALIPRRPDRDDCSLVSAIDASNFADKHD